MFLVQFGILYLLFWRTMSWCGK